MGIRFIVLKKNMQNRQWGQNTGCRHVSFLQTRLLGGLSMGFTDIHLLFFFIHFFIKLLSNQYE